MAAARRTIDVHTKNGKETRDAFRRVQVALISNTVLEVQEETGSETDVYTKVREFSTEQFEPATQFARAHFVKLNGLGNVVFVISTLGD